MELNEYKKKSRQGAIISVIGVLSALTALIFLIFSHPTTETINQVGLIKKDSIRINLLSTAVNQIKKFIVVSNQNNSEKIEFFFADTLNTFFLKENVSKDSAKNDLKWYWKTYSNIRIVYDTIDITTNIMDSTSYIVYLKSKNIKGLDTTDIISEIRMDKKFKIYYIRDFFANKK